MKNSTKPLHNQYKNRQDQYEPNTKIVQNKITTNRKPKKKQYKAFFPWAAARGQ